MKRNLQVYFAHPRNTYGSRKERAAHGFLGKMFGNLVCPNRDLDLGDNMDRYYAVVKKSHLVVCMENRGFIGKGVFCECDVAMANKIPVLVYRYDGKEDRHWLETVISLKVHDENDCKYKYGRVVIYNDVIGE